MNFSLLWFTNRTTPRSLLFPPQIPVPSIITETYTSQSPNSPHRESYCGGLILRTELCRDISQLRAAKCPPNSCWADLHGVLFDWRWRLYRGHHWRLHLADWTQSSRLPAPNDDITASSRPNRLRLNPGCCVSESFSGCSVQSRKRNNWFFVRLNVLSRKILVLAPSKGNLAFIIRRAKVLLVFKGFGIAAWMTKLEKNADLE